MATRAVNNGESDLPRDVFELDKDERWQARLDEARARREIALREKAAGKTPKKRLKPWEVEGAASEKPIEPVVQPRDNDRVDFADRVETMRQKTSKNGPGTAPERLSPVAEPTADAEKDALPKSHNWARLVDPDFPLPPETPETPRTETRSDLSEPSDLPPVEAFKPPSPDEFDNILTTLAKPRSAKKPTNLLLPDAPDVKELAARYAATLEPEVVEEEPEAPVAEPEVEEPVVAPKPARSRRPLALASVALLLALVPFVSEAPPIEKGPPMPPAIGFAFQPALGVTWSLQEVPVPTKSGEWVPRASWSPVAPMQPISGQPAEYATQLDQPSAPAFGEGFDGVPWTGISPVQLGAEPRLFVPQRGPGAANDVALTAITGFVPAGRSALEPNTEKLPDFGNAPTSTRPPLERPTEPDAVPEEASFVPPKRLPERPLKITILRPAQADERVAMTIAQDVSDLGHELVRVQSVNHSISARNLRYFFAADRPEAERLAKAYEAELRDFTWFRPRPDAGTAELWLTGKSTAQNPVVAARPRVQQTTSLTPSEPQQVLPMPQIVEPRKSLFERIFLSHRRTGVTPNLRDGDSGGYSGTQASATTDTTTGDTGTGAGGTATGTGGTTGTGTGSGTGTDTGTGGTDTGSGSDTGGSDTGGSDTGGTDTGGTDTGSGGTGGGNGNGNGNGNT